MTGYEADRFEQAAQNYLLQLQKAASRSGEELSAAYEKRLKKVDVGTSLFANYEKKIQSLKAAVKEKTVTLKRYDALLADLKELRRGA